MKLYTKLALLFIFSSAIIVAESRAQSKMPDSRMTDMKLTVTQSGGMTNFTEETVISEEGYISTQAQTGEPKITSLTFTTAELNSLLLYLKKKNFDKIKVIRKKRVTPDMSTLEISLITKDKAISIRTGAAEEVRASDKANYSAIVNYIEKMIAKKKK
jgi:hypothetical protein